jgi:GDP-L-fucose synthase
MTAINNDPRAGSGTGLRGTRVWIAGHTGLVGSALCRRLEREDCEILTVGRSKVDLTRQAMVESWVANAQPQFVFVAAARVGGIRANTTHPADFLYDNLAISLNVMQAAYRAGVEKLLFLGSSCIYPKHALQPISEDALLTGPLEPTNEAYAIAKIAGLKLAEMYSRQHGCMFIGAMPTNLYGPNDNFDLESSHVVPALIRKIHEAKRDKRSHVEIWGSGNPWREFLHVDDLADACVFLMKHYRDPSQIVNVGYGEDISVRDLASLIAEVVGFSGTFVFDRHKPDGSPRKLLDCRRLAALGWRPSISLRDGLLNTYRHWQGLSN